MATSICKVGVASIWCLFLIALARSETCSTVNDCDVTPCTTAGWRLECRNRSCICADPCHPNPCGNGRCSRSSGPEQFTCRCHLGFTGATCEVNGQCDMVQCQNGGTCHLTNDYPYYYCACPVGYSGTYCQNNVCYSNPCMAGTCTPNSSDLTQFTCACPAGFSGNRCEVNHNCDQDHCQNGGTCHVKTSYPYYYCSCPHGYNGYTCQHKLLCTDHTCPHGYVCHEPYFISSNYTCVCVTDACREAAQRTEYIGVRSGREYRDIIQIHGNDNICYDGYCQHHGSCWLSHSGEPHCHCRPWNTGQHCEHYMCHSHPCHNGAACHPAMIKPRYYQCNCTDMYEGVNCEVLKPTESSATKPTQAGTSLITIDPQNVPLYCLSCTDAVSTHTCDRVAKCGIHEVCYVEQFVNTVGSIRYNMGCKDRMQCMAVSKRVSGDIDQSDIATPIICSHCCEDSLCNSGGCGLSPFPANDTRGPICFNCDQQLELGDCDTIQMCGRDEACEILEVTIGTTKEKVWQTKCSHEQDCIHKLKPASNSLIGRRKRSMSFVSSGTPCVRACCDADLCNQYCPDGY